MHWHGERALAGVRHGRFANMKRHILNGLADSPALALALALDAAGKLYVLAAPPFAT
jgi:hypothetical protein